MNIIKQILLLVLSTYIFIGCVSEPKLEKKADIVVTIEYNGEKSLNSLNFKLYDFAKGVESEPIFEYSKKATTPHLFEALDIEYGDYIAVIYGAQTGETFNKDSDPFFITEKIVVDQKDLDLTYTIIAKDECSPNNCKNGSKCTKVGEDDYSCECPEGFEGKNCEIQITTDYSCLDDSCTSNSDCNCDATYCTPRTATNHVGVTSRVCVIKGCRGNEAICPDGYTCIDSHYGETTSFCYKLANEEVGEITFNVDYKGNKKIKKIGIGFYVNDGPYSSRRMPPFAAASPNTEILTFPYSFKVKPSSKNLRYIWVYGSLDGRLFPYGNDPQAKKQINITSDPQTIDIELK